MYDLLLKGGTVVDPSAGLSGTQDVAVQGGVIARIAANIPSAESAQTIDVRGKVVTPGLIDLHAHVFEGFTRSGVHPDLAGRARGRDHHRRCGQRGVGHLQWIHAPYPSPLPHGDHSLPAHLPDRARHHAGYPCSRCARATGRSTTCSGLDFA